MGFLWASDYIPSYSHEWTGPVYNRRAKEAVIYISCSSFFIICCILHMENRKWILFNMVDADRLLLYWTFLKLDNTFIIQRTINTLEYNRLTLYQNNFMAKTILPPLLYHWTADLLKCCLVVFMQKHKIKTICVLGKLQQFHAICQ